MLSLTKIKNLLLEILFPPLCCSCHQNLSASEKENGLCSICFSKILIHTTLFCAICRARLPENKKVCHKNSSFTLGAATDYEVAARNLIHALKYRKWSRLQTTAAKILIPYLQNLTFKKSDRFSKYLVIPIPLHKNREQSRGFNQSKLIAEIISNQLKLPLITGVLVRVKDTKTQTDFKDWEQRTKNVSGAFQIAKPDLVKGKNLILVDDVYTSGSTINEAVQILRAAGAKKITAIVLAKTK